MDNLINLTPLFEAVIAVLFAVLVTKVLPLVQARLDDDQEARLATAVHIAVYAAEKIYGAGNGATKLAYAEKMLREQFGFDVQFDKLLAMINAEIRQMELKEFPEIAAEPEIAPEQGVVDYGLVGEQGEPGEPGMPEA